MVLVSIYIRRKSQNSFFPLLFNHEIKLQSSLVSQVECLGLVCDDVKTGRLNQTKHLVPTRLACLGCDKLFYVLRLRVFDFLPHHKSGLFDKI